MAIGLQQSLLYTQDSFPYNIDSAITDVAQDVAYATYFALGKMLSIQQVS